MPQTIRVGHSPDPDDAFMFHALANGKIDTGRYEFVHELVDIETLNRRAFAGELELTALSLHAYAHLADIYSLCPCGASMGDRYGPMVVTREARTVEDLGSMTIAGMESIAASSTMSKHRPVLPLPVIPTINPWVTRFFDGNNTSSDSTFFCRGSYLRPR